MVVPVDKRRRSRDAFDNGDFLTSAWQQEGAQDEPCPKRQRTEMADDKSVSYSSARNDINFLRKSQPLDQAQGDKIQVDSVADEEGEGEQDEEMLSEEEKARRRSMLQLVMGAKTHNFDPVDRKLEQLIRQSRLEAAQSDGRQKFALMAQQESSSGEANQSNPPYMETSSDMPMSESSMDVD